jgi:hypothetical protein
MSSLNAKAGAKDRLGPNARKFMIEFATECPIR